MTHAPGDVENMRRFRQALGRHWEKSGLSLPELGEKLGVSDRHLQFIISHERHPSAEFVLRFQKLIGPAATAALLAGMSLPETPIRPDAEELELAHA
ncbi:MAG: helix-turn-helix transcriptional regulator [Verrucomicrobia bacterium]|nr:helix-turn-helix transcriptional regulator [Verrucomicrobiota bacterium]